MSKYTVIQEIRGPGSDAVHEVWFTRSEGAEGPELFAAIANAMVPPMNLPEAVRYTIVAVRVELVEGGN